MAHSATFSARANFYLTKIDDAKTQRQLDDVVENSSYDEALTNDEYCTIYGYALNKYRAIEAGF